MGIFDWLFGGDDDGGSSTVNTTQTMQVDPQIKAAGLENYDLAKQIAGQAYQPRTFARVADFTNPQIQAFNSATANVGAYKPLFGTAINANAEVMPGGTMTVPGMDLASYMSPFIQGALNPTLTEINRQSELQRRQIAKRAAMSGAKNGARHGVAEGALSRNTGQLLSDTTAKGYAAAFDQALAAMGADRSAMMQGSTNLANLATAGQKYDLTDYQSLLDVGNMQQTQAQKNLDVLEKDFLEQRDWPLRGLNIRTSALSGVPYDKTTSGTQPGANTTAQNVGAFSALLGGGSMLYNALK